MDPTTLRMQLGVSAAVLKRNVEGLTHEDSLVQPKPGGNCANWVLGHMVRTRNNMLPLLGKDPLYPRERFAAYEIEPITDGSDALRFEELLEAYERTNEPFLAGIGAMTAEQLAKPAPLSPTGNPDETVGSLLAVVAFHEAYHSGQMGMLRRLVGKEGVIKSPEAAAR